MATASTTSLGTLTVANTDGGTVSGAIYSYFSTTASSSSWSFSTPPKKSRLRKRDQKLVAEAIADLIADRFIDTGKVGPDPIDWLTSYPTTVTWAPFTTAVGSGWSGGLSGVTSGSWSTSGTITFEDPPVLTNGSSLSISYGYDEE